MFGIEDIYYVFKNGHGNGKPEKGYDRTIPHKETFGNPCDEPWFCFLPAIARDSEEILKNVLSKKGFSTVYRLPKDIVVSDPYKSKSALDLVFEDAMQTFENSGYKTISTLGVSIGGIIAHRMARTINANRLLIIAPGADLSNCIRHCIASREIYNGAINNGYCHKDFQEALYQYDPIKHCNLTSKVHVELGAWDLMVPYREGQRLVREFQKNGVNLTVNVNRLGGHGLTIKRFKNPY